MSTPAVLRAAAPLVLAIGIGCCANSSRVCAQAMSDDSEGWREPILPRGLAILGSGPMTDFSPASRLSRFALFRMPSAYPNEPVGFDSDADPPPEEPSWSAALRDKTNDGDGRVQLAIGVDNPFLDFRLPRDPGGIGYYRLHSQALLLDSRTACLSMGFQAVTPAGLENEGLPGGHTVLSPNFAWACDLNESTAIQGFLGKNVHAGSRWSDRLERDFCYGLALLRPFPGLDANQGPCVHVFMEALGHYRADGDVSQRLHRNLEVLPGLHWRLSENLWMSGGVLLPVVAPYFENRFLQITCSWHF